MHSKYAVHYEHHGMQSQRTIALGFTTLGGGIMKHTSLQNTLVTQCCLLRNTLVTQCCLLRLKVYDITQHMFKTAARWIDLSFFPELQYYLRPHSLLTSNAGESTYMLHIAIRAHSAPVLH